MTAAPNDAALQRAVEALEGAIRRCEAEAYRHRDVRPVVIDHGYAHTILAALKQAQASDAEQARSQEAATASAVEAARADEREACARVAWACGTEGGITLKARRSIAAAIRSRDGEK